MSRHKPLRIALLALLLIGAGQAGELGCHLQVHTEVNQAGELWANVNGQAPERLWIGAQDFRPLLSPNGAWLAVEARLMSNIGVVLLFRREGNRFVPAAQDVTGLAWKMAGERERFDPATVENPQTYVHGWENQGRLLQIKLRGLWGEEPEFREILVRLRLEPDT